MEIIRIRLISSEETEGCEKAPIEILKSLRKIKTSESENEIDVDKLNLEEIHINLEDKKEANHLIYENSKESFEKNFKTFFIGGDGSICYPISNAFNKIEENPLLIIFDAHGDCKNTEGINNKNWLRKLIEKEFDGKKIVLIGSRNLSLEERNFIKKEGITLIKLDLIQEDINEVCDLIMERARTSSGFFISIDIDCVDPAFAPGVTNPEPGGLSSREIIYFIKRLKLLNNFRGADINETNISKDLNEITIKLSAKLLSEMI